MITQARPPKPMNSMRSIMARIVLAPPRCTPLPSHLYADAPPYGPAELAASFRARSGVFLLLDAHDTSSQDAQEQFLRCDARQVEVRRTVSTGKYV